MRLAKCYRNSRKLKHDNKDEWNQIGYHSGLQCSINYKLEHPIGKHGKSCVDNSHNNSGDEFFTIDDVTKF